MNFSTIRQQLRARSEREKVNCELLNELISVPN
jgi:hypothetical protein